MEVDLRQCQCLGQLSGLRCAFAERAADGFWRAKRIADKQRLEVCS